MGLLEGIAATVVGGLILWWAVRRLERKHRHQEPDPAPSLRPPPTADLSPQPPSTDAPTGQPRERERAQGPVEQSEAASKPCVVPRQFPEYNPEAEDILLPEDQITLQIENRGIGSALNVSVFLQVPGEEFPEPAGRGPFQVISLGPGERADTGILVLSIPGMGPRLVTIYFDSVTGRRYWTLADMTMTGPAGGLWLTPLKTCVPVSEEEASRAVSQPTTPARPLAPRPRLPEVTDEELWILREMELFGGRATLVHVAARGGWGKSGAISIGGKPVDTNESGWVLRAMTGSLKDKGFIEVDGNDYRITPHGERALAAHENRALGPLPPIIDARTGLPRE